MVVSAKLDTASEPPMTASEPPFTASELSSAKFETASDPSMVPSTIADNGGRVTPNGSWGAFLVGDPSKDKCVVEVCFEVVVVDVDVVVEVPVIVEVVDGTFGLQKSGRSTPNGSWGKLLVVDTSRSKDVVEVCFEVVVVVADVVVPVVVVDWVFGLLVVVSSSTSFLQPKVTRTTNENEQRMIHFTFILVILTSNIGDR